MKFVKVQSNDIRSTMVNRERLERILDDHHQEKLRYLRKIDTEYRTVPVTISSSYKLTGQCLVVSDKMNHIVAVYPGYIRTGRRGDTVVYRVNSELVEAYDFRKRLGIAWK